MRLKKFLPAFLALALVLIAYGRAEKEDEKFLLVLDPGHTPEEPGAISARGKPEREFNFAMTRLLVHNLRPLVEGPGLFGLVGDDDLESGIAAEVMDQEPLPAGGDGKLRGRRPVPLPPPRRLRERGARALALPRDHWHRSLRHG